MRVVSQDPELAERFRRAACVLFDCDGVLFDSNGFKVDAMRHALAAHDETRKQAMLEYWSGNGGVSRWVKFRYFFEHIAPDTPSRERAIERAIAQFGDYSFVAYDAHEPVAEALAVVRAAGPERCVVVSGASQEELRAVFAKKGIASLFGAILGSPTTKLELVSSVLSERRIAAKDALFIGDGAGDFRVASELGVPFVYLDQFSEWGAARETLSEAAGVTWADTWPELALALDVRLS